MFGITVVDLPNPDKLYLPEDWPDHEFPLRKDWDPQKPTAVTGEGGR
jgi:Ni,Fe-hydrogenase III component G